MIMLTAFFLFSLFSIAIMIGFRAIEEKNKKRILFSKFRNRADVSAIKICDKIKKTISVLSVDNIRLFASFLINLILEVMSKTGRKIKLEKLKFGNSFEVNRNLKKKGSASFFLKNMSEYKGRYIK